jgi:subtilisin family serine protease
VYSTATISLGNSAPPTGSHRLVQLDSTRGRVQVAESSTFPEGVSDHAEGVAYVACSNTYGWATGAQIYIWPRNQVGGFSSVYEDGWDTFRLFHQNKIANGNTRPTIVIDSIASRFDPASKYYSVSTGLYFRNTFHNVVAPGAASEVAIQGFNQLQGTNSAAGVVYGNTYTSHYSGYYSFDGVYDGSSLSSDDLDEIATKLSNGDTESNVYESRMKPLEDMISAGVHHVSAAGNYNTSTALPGGIDYNNGQWGNYGYDMDNLGNFFPFMRRNYYCAGDTITCASLASFFTSDRFDGKETMSDFSCRGESVDTCAAGESIYANMFSNGYYAMSGTSFASPNIAGMACLVLQLHPTTTPRQLRRFFRFYAVGEAKLYETGIEPVLGSKFGDSPFFNDVAGNRGYSGNIAFLDLDASKWQNPTQLSNDPITSTMTTVDNKLNFSIEEINSKLGSV